MKKALLTLMCLAAMMVASTSLKAQEVTIVLTPGWNWISHPSTDTVDFATAFGSFTPATGDVIKSRWGQAFYTNNRWMGSISQFYPGYGYMYKSNRMMPVMVTFNVQQPTPQVVVTTSEPMMITAISAMGGGEVTVSDGTYILVKGLCWATHENPTTNDDFYQEAESGVGSFSISMTDLNIGTTYYVRAYAVTPNGTVYGDQKTFTTRDGIPTLTTTDITNITGNSARSGGNITDNGGLNVTARGVCWSTSPNPTVNDSHTTNGTGMGTFNSFIAGLDFSTTYYVRAYATTNAGTGYGNQLSFTTENDLAFIDLGLPSGTLWATCNVGADNPEDYGDYFAWGETTPKDFYDWSTYQYCNGSGSTLTKYCNNSSYGYNGFTDNLTTLLPEDDAATANWGDNWRMPTEAEWRELRDNTTVTWTTQNGVNGRLFTANNGNSLFLPAAGYRENSSLSYAGSSSYYWSSSLITGYPYVAWAFYFFSGNYGMSDDDRYYGQSVRAVRSSGQSNAPTGAINGLFTINENGDQVYFSQGNLQYQASTDTWKFADNQYDYVGSDNSNISSTYSGWIDLFGWGTSGWNSGNTYYHPWDSDNQNGALYGPPGTYNLTGSYANADWGVYNPISNGGNQSNQWRTLTQPEWNYVFNTRTTTSGIRYAKVNVNNVNGIILLPDDWSTSTYSFSNTNSSGASFSSNTLTASQWSALEQAGAVFLPAAGYRYGTSVSNVSSYGSYWSASYYYSGRAYCVDFLDLHLSTVDWSNRYAGQSVRLVRVAEN